MRTGCHCLISLSACLCMRTGCHYLISLSVCVCVTFVVYTDCGSCTKPISTNPASMEESEYGLTRGTCFVARRHDVVAVARLLWMSSCVFGCGGLFREFSFSNAHGLLQVRRRLASFTSLLVMKPFFALGKKVSSYRGAYGVPLFN